MTVCKATLTELEPMGPGLLRVRLEPGDPAFSFVAGQWIDLGVDIDGEQVVAGYSPSSSPSQRDFFELGVRLGAGSVERARQIAMGEWDDLRAQVENFIEAGLAHRDEVFWHVVEELSGDRAIQDRFLKLSAFYLRDFFLLNHERKGRETMVDRSAYLGRLSEILNEDHIERAMLEIDRAAEALSRNASFQLVVSDLWRCLRRAGHVA